MKTRSGRLVYARFLDPDNTMIRAEFKNYEDGAKPIIEHYSFNPEDKTVKQILEVFSPEDLERNYVQWNKDEHIFGEYYRKFADRYQEIIEYLDSGAQPTVVEEKPISLQTIKDVGNNPEDFFKLKLEIFELEEVKNSKNRKWKASMRKATTTLELLALLYEVYSTLENEEGERLD